MSLSLNAFNEIIDNIFDEYFKISQSIGGHVKHHAQLVKEAVLAQKKILELASKCKKPTDSLMQNLIKPLAEKINEIQQFREKNRTNNFFNHLSTISESIPALGWILVSPTPAPYVKEMSDSAQFYGNKVLVTYKEKNQDHVSWVRTWYNFLDELQKFIRQHHTSGLSWNLKGCDINDAVASDQSCRPGCPPPPPPPPAFNLTNTSSGGDNLDDQRIALMKDLNIGTDITKMLKKVTPDQQTHKNPNLRNLPQVKSDDQSVNNISRNKQVSQVQYPPKLCLEGRKWLVEYQKNQLNLAIQVNEMSESVHLYKCQNTFLLLKGKVNSIIMDSCVKTSIVFDDVVSSVEFINCQDVKAQSIGKVPTISIEKTDFAQIYLSDKSLNSEIITAKSSSVIVNVPDEENGYLEHSIPEQFKSVWKGKGFRTEPNDIAG